MGKEGIRKNNKERLSKKEGVIKSKIMHFDNFVVKMHYIPVWKYHSETPHFVQLVCANKNN